MRATNRAFVLRFNGASFIRAKLDVNNKPARVEGKARVLM
jgi:hypothetical protein